MSTLTFDRTGLSHFTGLARAISEIFQTLGIDLIEPSESSRAALAASVSYHKKTHLISSLAEQGKDAEALSLSDFLADFGQNPWVLGLRFEGAQAGTGTGICLVAENYRDLVKTLKQELPEVLKPIAQA